MRYISIPALALALTSFQTSSAFAEEGHKHLDAHEHGAGQLMVAVEGPELLVELRLPGMDAVGFEHAPENQAQHEAVEKALKTLNSPMSWIELSKDAKCALEEAHITSPFKDEHDDDHKDEHAHHDEHEHEKEHGDEHEHGEETHSEFMAEYHFHCDAAQNLVTLNVKAFDVFPTLEEIDYQAIGPKGQLGGELEPGKTTIDF